MSLRLATALMSRPRQVAPSQTRWGVDLMSGGWAALFPFETATGVPTACLRVFGGGSNSTTHAARAATARSGTSGGLQPGCDIYLSCRFAETPSTSDATIISYLQDVQEIAADTVGFGSEFFLSVNPEPDRADRTYTDAEWITMHERVWTLGQTHAPDVTWIFNLTGYDFLGRIGRYAALDSATWDMLCVDTYWLESETHQASVDSTIDAHAWVAANHPSKRFGEGEWGVEVGSQQHDDLVDAIEFMAGLTDPPCEIAPYFEDDEAWDTRLVGSGNEATYGSTVDAL